jgi:predicted transcriptional regulator
MDEIPINIIITSTITSLKLFNNSLLNTTTIKSNSILMEEPPVEAWCFDLLLFYRSLGDDDPQAKKMLAELEA